MRWNKLESALLPQLLPETECKHTQTNTKTNTEDGNEYEHAPLRDVEAVPYQYQASNRRWSDTTAPFSRDHPQRTHSEQNT